jgi:hypothetical protein
MKLLMRPSAKHGESWPGYLLRLADENRYDGIPELARGVGVPASRLIAAEPRRVLELFGIQAPDIELDGVARDIDKPWRNGEDYWHYGRFRYAGICPACMSDTGQAYCRARWEQALEVGCSIHECGLVHRCTGCSKKISVLRFRLTMCDCGYRYSDAPRLPLPKSLETMKQVLDVRRHIEDSQLTFQPCSYQEYVALFLLRRIKRSTARGRSIEPVGPNALMAMPLTLSEFNATEAWFRDWPEGFRKRFRSARGLVLPTPPFPQVRAITRQVERARWVERKAAEARVFGPNTRYRAEALAAWRKDRGYD